MPNDENPFLATVTHLIQFGMFFPASCQSTGSFPSVMLNILWKFDASLETCKSDIRVPS